MTKTSVSSDKTLPLQIHTQKKKKAAWNLFRKRIWNLLWICWMDMNLMEDALNSLRTRKLRPKGQILVLEEDLGLNRDQGRQNLEPEVQGNLLRGSVNWPLVQLDLLIRYVRQIQPIVAVTIFLYFNMNKKLLFLKRNEIPSLLKYGFFKNVFL